VSISEPPSAGLLAWIELKFSSRLVKVLLVWSLVTGVVVAFVFAIVAYQEQTSLAYDLLTLHTSPIGSDAGVPGFVLGTLGYLLVPALIGAIVSALFSKSMRVSRAQHERDLQALAKQVQTHLATASPPSTPANNPSNAGHEEHAG
jgi:hypothetical protein